MKKIAFSLLLALVALAANAQDSKNAFVLQTGGEDSKVFNFEKYDRISFLEECMVLSSTSDETLPTFQIPYDSSITVGTDKGGIATSVGSSLKREARLKLAGNLLAVSGEEPEAFAIAVYSMGGALQMQGKGLIDIASLGKGTYLVVATDGTNNLTARFIKQ